MPTEVKPATRAGLDHVAGEPGILPMGKAFRRVWGQRTWSSSHTSSRRPAALAAIPP